MECQAALLWGAPGEGDRDPRNQGGGVFWTNKWFSPEVITAMLVHRTKEKKIF